VLGASEHRMMLTGVFGRLRSKRPCFKIDKESTRTGANLRAGYVRADRVTDMSDLGLRIYSAVSGCERYHLVPRSSGYWCRYWEAASQGASRP
jgi:hypothetical protein